MARVKTVPLTSFIWESNDTKRYCCHPGCRSFAEFPAPHREGKRNPHDQFCLEHARLHNEAWDYFADMSPEEIDYHRCQDMIGWRPSWPLGTCGASFARVIDPFDIGDQSEDNRSPGSDGVAADRISSDLPANIRRALNILGLSPSATLAALKTRYKKLARRFHPDANGGDRRYEERFKKVHEAYEQLSAFFDQIRPSV